MPILKLNNQGKMSSGFWISPTAFLTTRHSMPSTAAKVRCKLTGNEVNIGDNADGSHADVLLHPDKDIALLQFEKPMVANFLPLGHLQIEDGTAVRMNIKGYPMNQKEIVKRHVDNVTTEKTDQDIVIGYELNNQGISAGLSGSPVLLEKEGTEYAIGTVQRGGVDSYKSLADSFWTIRDWLQEYALVMFTRLNMKKDSEPVVAASVENVALKNIFSGDIGSVHIGDVHNNIGKRGGGDE